VTRALLAGLISPDDTSEPICSATHTHVTAVQGAKLIARAVEVAVKEERLFSSSDVDSSMAHYKKLVPKAVDLATAKEYNEEDEFTTDLQDRFRARFGLDASSQCAVASTIFALHRTVHSLPYLNAASEEYQERILTVARAGMEKEKRGVAMNVLGNSNRLDTALLFSKLTPSIEQDLPVAIAVGWAISLGGDVRSNACLAGGLAGALWGEQGIPDEWLMFSEGTDEARHLADDLFRKSGSSS
jgi:ADP-ribosylglycohydrolase